MEQNNPSNDNKIDGKVIQALFQKSADIQFQRFTFHEHPVLFVTCQSMVNEQLFHQVIVERVQIFLEKMDDKPSESEVVTELYIPSLEKVNTKEELITSVYTGKVLLYFESFEMLFASDIRDKPNRSPEDTKTEVPVKGPRDNFIEDINVNIALIRKRLPTNSLCVEKYEVGRRTKTTVALLYFDDIVNKDTLQGVVEKLEKIDVDIIFSGEVLMEYIDKPTRLFPRHDYTGRPDFSVQSLARGRIIILVDGVAYGVVVPINLLLLFKTSEDNEYPTMFSSFERLLRLLGAVVGTFLPAFWLALTTYNQNQLPLQLLATVVQTSTGLPFPAALEMLIMLVMFELFREAGLRLPEAIGGTLSVVGGIIIGDAAIRAGVTSPAMVVIIAVSVIATFTLLNQSFVSAASLVRIFSIMATALLGLFGFYVSFFVTLLFLANIRVFGVPYLSLADDLSITTIAQTILRLPQKKYPRRPVQLEPVDDTRMEEENK